MKALLYKDAMVLWKQMKLMLLLILIFAVIPSEFQNTFAVLYAALLPYSALAYDERSRWDRMAAAMPYSARDIVTEKYVFGWIAALGTLALTLVLRLVSQYLLHLGEGASAEMLLIAFFGSLIAMAVTLPMMFRFGVEKGRLAMLLLIGLICGGAAGVAGMETFAVGSVQNLPVLPLAAAAVIAGHIFPVFMEFRGGKGLACLAGALIRYDWRLFLLFLAAEAVLALVTDYICVIPLTASVAFAVIYAIQTHYLPGVLLFVAIIGMIYYKHMENLKRIRSGGEMHLSYLWHPREEEQRMEEYQQQGQK